MPSLSLSSEFEKDLKQCKFREAAASEAALKICSFLLKRSLAPPCGHIMPHPITEAVKSELSEGPFTTEKIYSFLDWKKNLILSQMETVRQARSIAHTHTSLWVPKDSATASQQDR